MAIFDLDDLEGARERAEELGVRTVWRIDLPDISGTHLHPADTRGAIVSLDQSRPYGSWRWGGPEWTEKVGEGAPGRLAGITVAVADPANVAARWAAVLGFSAQSGAEPTLALDSSEVRFTEAPDERAEGLTEIAVELPPERRADRTSIELGGISLRFLTTA
jgi:hypothetical protein